MTPIHKAMLIELLATILFSLLGMASLKADRKKLTDVFTGIAITLCVALTLTCAYYVISL